MTSPALTPVLANILSRDAAPETILADVIPVLGRSLRCDRCFLYLRHPQKRVGQVAYCWISKPDIPTILDADWKPEPANLDQEDPLFAAALKLEAAIFIEDVETADAKTVNQEFEQKNFGHRALAHSHLIWQGELWGILQPAVFGRTRVWEDFDRTLIAQITQELAPLAAAYIQKAI